MNKIKSTLLMTSLFMGLATVAQATPFIPTPGPLYIQFSNREQIDPSGTMLSPSGKAETNWGVLKVSTIQNGDTSTNPQNFDPGGSILWATGAAEITGIFGNASLSPSPGALNSSGGSVYLYYDDTPDASLAAATPGQRGSGTGVGGVDFQFTNFTDGVFLAKIDFVNGAILPGDLDTSITGTATPASGGFRGTATSFGSIDLTAGGLWSVLLDSNYFTPQNNLPKVDIAFSNGYQSGATTWDDFSNPGRPIFGATSSDPALAVAAVPEPSTFALFGLGLLATGLIQRRRKA